MVIVELKGSSVEMVVKLTEVVHKIIWRETYNPLVVKSFCFEVMVKIVERQDQEQEGLDEEVRYATGLLWASRPENIVMTMHRSAIKAVADRLGLKVCCWVVNDVDLACHLANDLGCCVLTESRDVVEALQADE